MSGLERLTVRERIVRELVRRISAADFGTSVKWSKVIRRNIPDAYDTADGAIIAVLEGQQVVGAITNVRQCELLIFVQFAVPLGKGEEPAAVYNQVIGELDEVFLRGDRQIKEGGTGPALAQNFVYRNDSAEMNDEDSGDVASGTIEFLLTYRTRPTGPFDL